ncbi:MAG TPA: molybdate ABC transporter substrate-binding protein [Anaerolineales bacterium]|nr:molybdate ABC transporter substrate-binding protein [Anaerolineales bacterium]
MRKIILLTLLLALLTGCILNPSKPEETQLIIFAASSLTNAFMDLADAFEAQYQEVNVVLNFASSAQLAAQLIEGAQTDIYASANQTQMQNVVDAGLVVGRPDIFVSNQLTLLVPKDNPAGIARLADLANPSVTLILASPSTPIRVYSDQIIQNYADAAFAEAVYRNLASEEANVRQVVTKISLGEGDAGIVYTSDLTPDIAEHVTSIPIPQENNVVASYPIGLLTQGNNPILARDFLLFTLSNEGQAILTNWGFLPKQTPLGTDANT